MKLTLDSPEFAGVAGGVSLSVRIRERLMSTGYHFHVNDDIVAHLRDGELDLLRAEMEERLQAVLRAFTIDVEQDHNSRETTRHMAKMFIHEVFAGRYVEAPEAAAFPNAERLSELMVVGSLRMRSTCLHHLCPVMGCAWVGIMPRQDFQLIGLSKYTRLTDWVISHPQIQEEATKQIVGLLEDRMEPDGLAVMLEAEHYYIRWRGMEGDELRMISNVIRDILLTDASLQREFLALLPGHNGG